MKKMILFVFLIVALLLSACGGAPHPGSGRSTSRGRSTGSHSGSCRTGRSCRRRSGRSFIYGLGRT